MAKQAHDLGVRKRKLGQARKPDNHVKWQRAKRAHPGPLPLFWQNLQDWVKAGKPRWERPVG